MPPPRKKNLWSLSIDIGLNDFPLRLNLQFQILFSIFREKSHNNSFKKSPYLGAAEPQFFCGSRLWLFKSKKRAALRIPAPGSGSGSPNPGYDTLLVPSQGDCEEMKSAVYNKSIDIFRINSDYKQD